MEPGKTLGDLLLKKLLQRVARQKESPECTKYRADPAVQQSWKYTEEGSTKRDDENDGKTQEHRGDTEADEDQRFVWRHSRHETLQSAQTRVSREFQAAQNKHHGDDDQNSGDRPEVSES